MRTRAFGADSALVIRTTANLATVKSVSGNAAAAEPLYREVEAGMIRFYGPEKSLFDKTWKLPDIEQVN